MYLMQTSIEDYIRSFQQDFLPVWEKQNRLLSANVGLSLSNTGVSPAKPSRESSPV
jgi:hypothetical protein